MSSMLYNPKTMEWEPANKKMPVVTKKCKPKDEMNRHNLIVWARRLIVKIFNDYEVPYHPTVISRGKVSYHRIKKSGFHQIYLSTQTIEFCVNKYFLEYPSITPVWRKNGYNPVNMKGKLALWAVVLHEVAHALQVIEQGGRLRGSVHNQVFKNCLNELIILYPFDEVK